MNSSFVLRKETNQGTMTNLPIRLADKNYVCIAFYLNTIKLLH